MNKRLFFGVILVIALIFGITFVGCETDLDSGDSIIAGWDGTDDGYDFWKDGTFFHYKSYTVIGGTYNTGGNTLTLKYDAGGVYIHII